MNLLHAFAISTFVALAGCAGAGAVKPNALVSAQQEAIAAADLSGDGMAALGPSNPQLTIAPAIGAPDGASAPLAARLAARAQELGIPLNPAGTGSGLTMKGYFSAITEGGETTVIYVWDVVDGSGNRLTRIQGKESAPRAGGEGWNDVGPDLMGRVADQTIDAYASWLLARAA